MEIMTSWHREGIAEGITQGKAVGLLEGKETLVMRQLRRRFGTVSEETTARLDRLSSEQLDTLAEDLLDFSAASDLEKWLSSH